MIVICRLDAFLKKLQAIKLQAFHRRNGSNVIPVAVGNYLSSKSCVFTYSDLNILKPLQEFSALADSLFVRKDFLDIGKLSAGFCHKIVADTKAYALGDMEVVVLHQIVDSTHRAV